ncbi:SDR family NAD(P)-dependent oxidoreductase [Halobacillus naozhouensis]|uniref:SDR family oxidoreductase n=1 Tax=Halobacillus naozhouensis TaxID=554880 RepID=A0ABY8IWR7_9BACI|nr:SDR family oxidoreductase [Halobacillus naozhouensis]WFT74668.1 SDR family oxidoreductase [Halobacillus naozhouensis]
MQLENKVAIITGGAGGIGKGIAKAMLKEGAKVVIVDINKDAGQSTMKDLTKFGKTHFILKDISIAEHSTEIIQETIDTFGKLDILINNAHASRQKPFQNTLRDDFDLSFNTGFYPTVNLMQAEEWKQKHPEQYQSMISGIPLGRMGDPEQDIGKAAVFLSSANSSYITGQTIMVDGGTVKLT